MLIIFKKLLFTIEELNKVTKGCWLRRYSSIIKEYRVISINLTKLYNGVYSQEILNILNEGCLQYFSKKRYVYHKN